MASTEVCDCFCHRVKTSAGNCTRSGACCERAGVPLADDGSVAAEHRFANKMELVAHTAARCLEVGRSYPGDGTGPVPDPTFKTGCPCDCHRHGGRCGVVPCCDNAGRIGSRDEGCFG